MSKYYFCMRKKNPSLIHNITGNNMARAIAIHVHNHKLIRLHWVNRNLYRFSRVHIIHNAMYHINTYSYCINKLKITLFLSFTVNVGTIQHLGLWLFHVNHNLMILSFTFSSSWIHDDRLICILDVIHWKWLTFERYFFLIRWQPWVPGFWRQLMQISSIFSKPGQLPIKARNVSTCAIPPNILMNLEYLGTKRGWQVDCL